MSGAQSTQIQKSVVLELFEDPYWADGGGLPSLGDHGTGGSGEFLGAVDGFVEQQLGGLCGKLVSERGWMHDAEATAGGGGWTTGASRRTDAARAYSGP